MIAAVFDAGTIGDEMVERQLVGDDLAIGEGLVAGDMIEMVMADDEAQALHAHAFEEQPDLAGVGEGEMRVINEGVVLIDQRIARGAKREAAVIKPILVFRMEPDIWDAPVIERIDEGQRLQHAQMRDRIGFDHGAGSEGKVRRGS